MIRNVALILLSCAISASAATTRIANTQPVDGVEVVVNPIKTDATSITAKCDRVSASEMFNLLGREAGIVIAARDDSIWDSPTIAGAVFSSEWDRSPMWEAVREACESAEVRFETNADEPGLPRVLLSRGVASSPTCISGPLFFRAEQINRAASINYADNARSDDLVGLSVYVMLEPTMNRHRAAVGAVRIERAEDENGKSLATTRPANDRSDSTPTLPNDPRFTVPLSYPEGVGKKLAILRGTVPIVVAKESAVVTFNPPFERFKNVRVPVGTNLLTLESIESDENGSYRVKLKLARGKSENDLAWGPASKPLGQSASNAQLLSANGPFPRPGSSSNWNENEASTELHFSPREDKSPATSFRIEIPTQFTTLDAKFEFKDIPLP